MDFYPRGMFFVDVYTCEDDLFILFFSEKTNHLILFDRYFNDENLTLIQ